MFILDTIFIGGLRFVFDKIAAAVDTEMNDETALRDELLAAQMRVELGEMTPEAFAAVEADVVARLRVIRERRQDADGGSFDSRDYKVTGVEATFGGDDDDAGRRR